MTKQEMFDRVLEGIVAQGGGAIERGQCRYLTTTKRRCAAGLFLEGEEGRSMIGSAAFYKHRFTSIVGEENINFLSELQAAHDNSFIRDSQSDSAFLINFALNMKRLAASHNLAMNAQNLD
jgi:hypothetical protein